MHQRETVLNHQESIRRPDGSTLPVLVNSVALSSPEGLTVFKHETGASTHPAPGESVALVVHQDVSTLKEAEYLKDEFIGVAAHELRNPLTVLKGFADMLVYQTERGKVANSSSGMADVCGLSPARKQVQPSS